MYPYVFSCLVASLVVSISLTLFTHHANALSRYASHHA